MPEPTRSLTMDEALLRRMAADAAVYSLTRPWALVMWAALTAGLVVSILNVSGAEADAGPLVTWMPVAVLALAGYAVWLTVASARRAVRAAMPAGTTVWVSLDTTVLRVGAGTRTSELPFDTFRSLRAGRDAVLLRLRSASVVTAIPRALVSDEDLARLRAAIG
ncbi:MAG: YcxB family protein [Microbacterium sp.]|nr:YcxB family protein [Microbacterium sp.]